MTVPSAVDVVVDPVQADNGSYVDWPAIIAGIVVASAISLLLLTFGSAIGLSMTDFRSGEGVSPIWIAIAAALWLLWVQVSSFMAGGYLTGRLRKRHVDATEHEVDVRDGAHGVLVWAGALVVGAIVAVGGLGAAANAIGSAASTLTTAASNVAGETGEAGMDPTAYFTDMLFRPAPADGAAATDEPAADEQTTETPLSPPSTTTAAPAAGAPAAPATPAEGATTRDTSAVRAEAGRIFAASAISGELPAEDRNYLVQAVAANTDLSNEQAEARVDQVVTAMDTARAEATETAEAARKTGVLAAFLSAASLLVSAVGAFWAAQKGGQHRDEGTVFAEIFRRF